MMYHSAPPEQLPQNCRSCWVLLCRKLWECNSMKGVLQIFPSSPLSWPVSDLVPQRLTFCYHLPPFNVLHFSTPPISTIFSESQIFCLFSFFFSLLSHLLPNFILALLFTFPPLSLHVVVRKDSCTPWCSCILWGRRDCLFLSLPLVDHYPEIECERKTDISGHSQQNS